MSLHFNGHLKMILGIDCTNIGSGGGILHLESILRFPQPEKYGFNKVIIWTKDDWLSEKVERLESIWLKTQKN